MAEDIDMHPESSDSDWIRVTSNDGFSYMVKRKIANVSGTMKNMLDTESNYAESISRTVPVMQRGFIVEKLLEYMAFKAHYDTVGSKEDIPVHEYMERLPPAIVLELFSGLMKLNPSTPGAGAIQEKTVE